MPVYTHVCVRVPAYRALSSSRSAFMALTTTTHARPRLHVCDADDAFANIVLDSAVDEKTKAELGMVVVRGNSVITMEALESMAD